MSSNKEISLKFFTKVNGQDDVWQCKCGVRRKQRKNTGWVNLVTHIQQQHKCDVEKATEKISSYFGGDAVTDKAKNVFGWLDWVCSNLLPFNFVADQKTREYSTLSPISINSLMSYMEKVTKTVEEKISAELPSQFALVIDAWTHKSTHYVALFASYESMKIIF